MILHVGVCPFCLETMQDAPSCLRGACFHGFHKSCFRRWWQWRVQQHEAELRASEENRSTVGLGVAPVRSQPPAATPRTVPHWPVLQRLWYSHCSTLLQRKHQDIRQALCPVCRASIPQDQLASVLMPSELDKGYPGPQGTASSASEAVPLDSSLIAFIDTVSSFHKKIAAERQANQDCSAACVP